MLPQLLHHPVIPTRIRIHQRIVPHIAVAVITLRIMRRLNERVGAEEPADGGVVDPAVHMDQIDVVQYGIAAMQSLDDLGQEANKRAHDDERELWRRLRDLNERLKQLEGTAK